MDRGGGGGRGRKKKAKDKGQREEAYIKWDSRNA